MNKYFDFSNKRLLRLLIASMILLIIVTPFKTHGEPIWIQQCSQVAHPSDNITCGNTQITNVQFNAPVRGIKDFKGNIVPEYTVKPNILFNINNISNPIVLTVTDNTFIEQNNKMIKIVASGFTDGNSAAWLIESYNPQATITVYKRQLPQLEVSLRSDKSTYEFERDDNINITLTIKNIDKESLKTAKIKLIYSGLNASKSLSSAQDEFEYCCLNPDKTIEYTYNFDVENINKSYEVNATLELQDSYILNKLIKYNASIIFNVIPANVSGRVTVIKSIPSRFYTSDNVTEVITIINQGKHSMKSVEVTDSNDNVLFPTNNQKMYWNFTEIKSDSQKSITYTVYPVKSGSYTLSGTNIKYNYLGHDNMMFSNTISIDVIFNPNKPLRAAIMSMPIQNNISNNTNFNTLSNNNNTSLLQSPKIEYTHTNTVTPNETRSPNVKYIIVNSTPSQIQDTPQQVSGFETILVIIALLYAKNSKK